MCLFIFMLMQLSLINTGNYVLTKFLVSFITFKTHKENKKPMYVIILLFSRKIFVKNLWMLLGNNRHLVAQKLSSKRSTICSL